MSGGVVCCVEETGRVGRSRWLPLSLPALHCLKRCAGFFGAGGCQRLRV